MRVLLSCNSVYRIAVLNAPNILQGIIKLIEKEEIQIKHIFLNLLPIACAPPGPVKTHHPSKMHQNQAVGGAVSTLFYGTFHQDNQFNFQQSPDKFRSNTEDFLFSALQRNHLRLLDWSAGRLSLPTKSLSFLSYFILKLLICISSSGVCEMPSLSCLWQRLDVTKAVVEHYLL